MLRISRVLAVMLVAVLSTVALPAGDWSISAVHMGQSGGCHHKLPAPSPVRGNHQCCVAGHHFAVPGTPANLRPVVVRSEFEIQTDELEPFLTKNLPLSVVADSPPAITSLRI